MGLWGVLLEIARAVVPHAAPHVARAVVDRAKERRAAALAAERQEKDPQPSTTDLVSALNYLEQRLSAAEEKAATAEQGLAVAEERMAAQWVLARRWAISLLVWNGVVTAALIAVLIALLRR